MGQNLYIKTLALLISFAILVLFWWMFKTTTLFAADPLTYTLLADLPGIGDTPTPTNYLLGIIKLLIGLTTVLSVLMIVYAGVFGYVGGATSPGARSTANSQIQGALLGLILAISSYLILNEINPALLNLDLTLDEIPAASDSFSPCSPLGFNCLTSCPCPDPCESMSSPCCPNPDAALCAGFCGASCYSP